MNKLFKKINNRLDWIIEDYRWFLLRPVLRPTNHINKQAFTIGIATFMDRYDNCLKPLINKISPLFPDCQIIIAANGHVKYNEQLRYISDISQFCKSFKNVELITHKEPKGLSCLWNEIIKKSKNNKILILNDDIRIKLAFISFIENSLILNESIATINSTWSSFLISKEIVDVVGYFDEGLLEIGGEDDDYLARLAIAKIKVPNFSSHTIASKLHSKRKKMKFNSYGKDMTNEIGGYSTYNTEYLKKKWETSIIDFADAVEVPNRKMKFWKLRDR